MTFVGVFFYELILSYLRRCFRGAKFYLFSAFALHSIVGMYRTWNKRALMLKDPLAQGRLWGTGLFLAVFVVLHLNSFKFGPEYRKNLHADVYIPFKGHGVW